MVSFPSRAARIGLPALVLAASVPRAALAQDKKAECAAAYEQSQELRANGKLTQAKEKLVVCAQSECPSFVQSDCAGWLDEVQKEIPTIVFAARDQRGKDTAAVRVTMDGEELLGELTGKGVPVDPGMHEFHFEHEGAPAVDQKVLVRQGEKDRTVEIRFPLEADLESGEDPYGNGGNAGAGSSPDEPKAADAADSGKPGPLRPYAYVAGGVGAAGLVGWIVLGALGKGQESDLRTSCSPNCTQSQVDSVKTKYLLADVSLGVGIAGLGAGVALFFLSQPKGAPAEETARAVTFDVKASPSSAYATVSGRF